jgi:hypothetical protein
MIIRYKKNQAPVIMSMKMGMRLKGWSGNLAANGMG